MLAIGVLLGILATLCIQAILKASGVVLFELPEPKPETETETEVRS